MSQNTQGTALDAAEEEENDRLNGVEQLQLDQAEQTIETIENFSFLACIRSHFTEKGEGWRFNQQHVNPCCEVSEFPFHQPMSEWPKHTLAQLVFKKHDPLTTWKALIAVVLDSAWTATPTAPRR